MRVEAGAQLPERITLPPSSVITVLATLAGLAGDIFGKPGSAVVSCPEWEADPAVTEGSLLLCMRCEAALPSVEAEEAVSAAIIRSGVRSRAVVDLLYVEKIIEMRGGRLEFMREGEQVNGFAVHLPVAY